MIGYGSEDDHFVVELTWNTGVSEYKRGNDFLGVTIISRESLARAKASKCAVREVEPDLYFLESPDGYPFYLIDKPQPTEKGWEFFLLICLIFVLVTFSSHCFPSLYNQKF